MSDERLEELLTAAKKNALMPAAVVFELAEAVRMARWQAENYKKLADYYREGGHESEQRTAEPVRP